MLRKINAFITVLRKETGTYLPRMADVAVGCDVADQQVQC